MKRILFLLTFPLLLAGCDGEDALPVSEPPAGWAELVSAYEQEQAFVSAYNSSDACKIVFMDYNVTIPVSSFVIEDCTSSTPSTVTVNGEWWCVDNVTKPIRVETALANINARPVYAYFNATTLCVYVSNKEVMTFRSDQKEDEVPDDGSDEGGSEDDADEGDDGDENDDGAADSGDDDVIRAIPQVYVTTEGGAGIYDKKNYVRGSIKVLDSDHIYGQTKEFSAPMGIRGRGNSTWGWPKKPWKVKLDEKAEILGMPADKEWCLLANYADRTLVRNIVAMEISRMCGFAWTPRMRSVDVWLNDAYQGVYTFCEHKKVSSSRVNIDVVGEGDLDGEALTGGYYFEIEENQDETTCWWTSMGVPMMFSDPEEPAAEQLAYVKQYFDDFETALRSDMSASGFGKYADYIDVDSFINYYILQELTKNVDGNLRKSSFITKEKGWKLEMYHVWDFDLTLGNCGYFDWNVGNGPEGFYIRDYASSCGYGGGWFWYLFKDQDFADAVRARWNELKPQLETIPDFIDRTVRSLGESPQNNFRIWDINASVDWVKFPSLGSYEAEVKYLKDFYTSRLKWLDSELN